MANEVKKFISCGVLLIVLVGMVILSKRDPLLEYEISPYETEVEYWLNRQYYVVAEYPVKVNHVYWDEGDLIIVVDYVVEKQDSDGNYRTVYDSARNICPVGEELIEVTDLDYSIYDEITLQPLVEIYGEGRYRVLQLGRNTVTSEQKIIAHTYYMLSGTHLENKDTFKDVFPITAEDLQNLEIINGEANFALTEEEKEEFIDIILNMKFASVNKTYHNYLIMCLANGSISYGNNYRFRLNIPGEESCYIYSMTGKDLDGNAYQAVFVCGDTAICLDSEETILYKLDALKKKGALK